MGGEFEAVHVGSIRKNFLRFTKQLPGVVGFVENDRPVLRAVVADMAGEGAGVDAGDAA